MKHRQRTPGLFALIGYALAAVILAVGLAFTVAIVSGAAHLDGASLGLRGPALDALSDLIVGPLRHALFTAGTVAFAVTVLLSGLMFALGRLLATIRGLSQRVSALERALNGPDSAPPPSP